MSEDGRSRGCLKWGAFGCLAVVGLVVLVGLLVGGLQLVASRAPTEMVTEERHQAVPTTAARLADAGLPQELELDNTGLPPQGRAGSGSVALELAMGEFEIVPGEPGSEIEVEAEYDRSRFELVEELVEEDDGSWRYRVALEPRSRFLGFRQVHNQVVVRLPPDVPMTLAGRLRMGTSSLELGGLDLRAVDLNVGMGDHRVRFSAPTAAPLERFEIDGHMGSVRVRGLGNARPRSVEADYQMGELRLDLEGAWDGDSTIAVNCRMGECTLDVPDTGVRVVAERADLVMGGKSLDLPDASGLPAEAPTLTLDLIGSMGEVRVR